MESNEECPALKSCNNAIPFLAHPFRQVIHGPSTQSKSIRYGSLRFLNCIDDVLPSKRATPAAPVFSKPHLPRIYTGRISAFVARQSEWSGWIYILHTPLQFSSVIRIGERF
ncbi:hypothetical protein AVEN_195578-1 [Araneus ventricosus]|uniref:Uncharacterized protein n=1 Tax=Araneus ventricosus TaxID=182803 RepID=A0A4Y2WE21_ARAVE|nr:hypothetical protein AVEN_195578-1 [Araneus ventricosus]